MTMMMTVMKMHSFIPSVSQHTYHVTHLHCSRILGFTTILYCFHPILCSSTDRIWSSKRYSNQYQEYGGLLYTCRDVEDMTLWSCYKYKASYTTLLHTLFLSLGISEMTLSGIHILFLIFRYYCPSVRPWCLTSMSPLPSLTFLSITAHHLYFSQKLLV